mgnify:FL=1
MPGTSYQAPKGYRNRMPNSQTPGEPLSPEFRRELIRIANRNRLSADDVIDLQNLAEYGVTVLGYETPLDVYTDWRDSLDLEP